MPSSLLSSVPSCRNNDECTAGLFLKHLRTAGCGVLQLANSDRSMNRSLFFLSDTNNMRPFRKKLG